MKEVVSGRREMLFIQGRHGGRDLIEKRAVQSRVLMRRAVPLLLAAVLLVAGFAELAEGRQVERVMAWAMQPDPATRAVASAVALATEAAKGELR